MQIVESQRKPAMWYSLIHISMESWMYSATWVVLKFGRGPQNVSAVLEPS